MNRDHAYLFNEFISSQLNPEQQRAVLHEQGSLLVIAGAGSGKTRVITARIAHLMINCGVFPSAILALTFTNKAAQEMRERIHNFLGSSQHELPFIGTFHAYCLRLLKMNSHLLEHPFFSIMDEDDQQKLLNGIIQRNALNKKVTAKSVSYAISQIKNQSIDHTSHDLYSLNPLIRDMYTAYEHEKRISKCLDFDDLLIETLRLCMKNTEFKTTLQSSLAHILVDEYQDTNIVQHELLKQLALKENKEFALDSLCAVGDEDQSIYSWRGATVANMLDFTRDFPATITIKIEQNYRSIQAILDVANHVINYNMARNPKNLWSEKQANNRIRAVSCLSEYQEADCVAQCIKTVRNKKKLSTIAILYRTHFQSRALEEALIKQSIVYKIIGGIQFYERKEIKDMLAYLRLVVNPFDRTSLFRVINCPTRGLGAQFEQDLYTRWSNEPFLTFIQALTAMIASNELTKQKQAGVQEFIQVFTDLTSAQTTSTALEQIIMRTNYFSYLKESSEAQEAIERIENVKELLNAIKHFESQGIATISDFLDQVTLMQEIKSEQDEQDQQPVLLMTLHAAKGLEFDTVVLTGLEDGILPSTRSLNNNEQIEEERRLFYVGITRAQERLLLTHSRFRYTYGSMTDQRPSRFLQEIPTTLAPLYDASYWNQGQLSSFMNQWLGAAAAPTSSVLTFGKPAAKKPAVKEETVSDKNSNSIEFKKNQPVSHASFGIGIVKEIEKRGQQTSVVTVQFKIGIKKISSIFLTTV